MARTYGDSTKYYDARAIVKTKLDALKTAMVNASTNPAIASVYDSPGKSHNPTFPAVDIILTDCEQPIVGSFAGAVDDATFEVVIRVMIANADGDFDDIKFWDLANSIVNYFSERRSLDATYRITGAFSTSGLQQFEDNLTLGGTVSFPLVAVHTYTAA